MPSLRYSSLLLLAALCAAPVVVQGQVVVESNGPNTSKDDAIRVADDNRRTMDRLRTGQNGRVQPPRRGGSFPGVGRGGDYPEISSKWKKILTPAPEDKKANAEFLRQPDTGIFRLLPGGKYEFKGVVNVGELGTLPVPIRGAGAFYSFTKMRHEFDRWSDISLQDGQILATDTHESIGTITPHGTDALNSLTLNSQGVDYLATRPTPTLFADAVTEFKRLHAGYRVGNFTYKNSLPAILDTTYVLRSIKYNRADTLLAFRIIRVAEDGSLTILWKGLQKFQPPYLKDSSVK